MQIRPRFTIYGQILFWFFLNLALVAAVIFLVVKVQFGVDPREFLWGRTEQRFTAVATALAADLRDAPRHQWDELVTRYEKDQGVVLAVYRAADLARLAGSGSEFPESLRGPLRIVLPPRERGGPGTGPAGDLFAPGDGESRRPPPRRRDGPARRGPPAGNDPANRVARVFHVGQSGDPPQYLAAALVPLGSREFRHPPDGIVIARAGSLGGNGVFFDWRPWGWALGGVLLVSALVWLPFVMRLTGRLQRLTAAAETMAEGNFAVEVASKRGDELGRLSRAVQRMAGQLDAYVTGQKRFLGDIAHELCSPLARLRMALGVLEGTIPDAERGRLAALEEEAEELGILVNELLDFSRASLKPASLATEEVAVRDLLAEVAAREAPGATCRIDADPSLALTTNRDLLRRALANVVRNAARYAGAGGPIELRATAPDGSVHLEVRDHGPGIPEEWLTKVFEPFSRPGTARTREEGGAGLGLAIAKSCIDSLGGKIHARNRTDGGLAVLLAVPQNP
ncbi:MAG: HAMP domain-containing protein [Akkermansiaceae bacterium]|nr:HAMP domain-containing protein [Akkermansiaceae bacterium]